MTVAEWESNIRLEPTWRLTRPSGSSRELDESGLAINESAKRYTLKRLPGDYSGLQLVSMMHVGFRMFDPGTDPGTGLEHEYQMALSMAGDTP